jgi:type IV secretory pathway TraG/TraD family ATPase VirD4
MVTTSTKPDNLALTALAAPDRPLWVFDPTGLSGWPESVRWSPVGGCGDPAVASLRAEALVFASPEDPSVRGGRFWKDSAVTVLRSYLHAAALAGGDMRTVQRWARRHELDEPIAVLRDPGAAPGWVDDLDGLRRLAGETRASVFGQLTVSLGFLAAPEVLEACCPDPGIASLDLDRLLAERGRLYLVGTAAGQRSMAPLIAALVETIADTARRAAARAPGGRLSPPLGLLIDEAAQIAPLPSLPSLLADGGGQGIVTVVVLQSLGQARERWGEHGATALWDACTAKLVFGGLSSARDLEAIAKLCPDVDEPTVSTSRGRDGHWSESTSTRLRPAMSPAQLRELERWHALLLYPGLRPVLTEQRPWWREPRYEELIGEARKVMEGRLARAALPSA